MSKYSEYSKELLTEEYYVHTPKAYDLRVSKEAKKQGSGSVRSQVSKRKKLKAAY